MNLKIGIHELIGWLNADQNMIIERVLWIDEQYSFAFLYDIEAKKGFPREIAMADLLEAIEDERAIKISKDPWIRSSHDENLTDKEKEIRDKAWEIIRPLAKAEPAIYLRQERGKLIKKTIESYNEGRTQDKLVERTVYGYLRRYWQRGKNINALLPDLQNSSGKGKKRKAGEAKMGRKKKYQSHPDIYEGVNVTEADRQIFRQVLDQYYFNMSDLSLSHVYIRVVQKYYQVEIEFDEKKDKVGDTLAKIKSLRPDIPTFEQFYYFYRTEYTQIEVLEKRKGKKGFGANYRSLTGSAHAQIYGVGSQFQIDATTANVYLISKYNPELVIGRPTIYVVIDAFSHLIVGFYVGLKAPSWESAMTALANVATNKVELCREYGVEIQEEQWPCEELPMAIYADKGEMLWKPIETIVQNLDIVVDQAAAYRPDWKGLVESRFWIIRNKLEKILPGYVHQPNKIKDRICRRNYAKDATLTLDEFTQAIIYLILYHNKRRNEEYPLSPQMIADGVPPIPLAIWNWGSKKHNGGLKSFPLETVQANLLPRQMAKITAKGLCLDNKLCYLSTETNKSKQMRDWDNLYILARNGRLKEKKVEIAYDKRRPEFIYVMNEDGSCFEKFKLQDLSQDYIYLHGDEIDVLREIEAVEEKLHENEETQKEIDFLDKVDKIADKATQRKKANSHSRTRTQSQSVGENKRNDQKLDDQEKAFVLGQNDDISQEETANQEQNTVAQSNYAMLLSEIEDEIYGE